ncbi:C4-dicarboxylate ABC transporter substrate-binding protein, partial [Leifsonia sp. SIMBA_070]
MSAEASMEDYVAAFADVDPINLKVQSNNPQGTGQSVPLEAYVAAVEEWSGGKITFDVKYSGAIAPIAQAGQAMADG